MNSCVIQRWQKIPVENKRGLFSCFWIDVSDVDTMVGWQEENPANKTYGHLSPAVLFQNSCTKKFLDREVGKLGSPAKAAIKTVMLVVLLR